MSTQDQVTTLLKQRRSRRQVLASLGLGAAALYVAPTLLSMDQAEARDHGRSRPSRPGHHRGHSRPNFSRPSHSRPSHSQPNYSRPNYSRPSYSQPNYSRPNYARPDYSRPEYSRHGYTRSNDHRQKGHSRPYERNERARGERDGVIELRFSRLLPHRW